RAREVLAQLERPSAHVAENSLLSPQPSALGTSSCDPSLPQPHPIIEEVRQMDLFSMTPLEALNRLADLQRLIDSENRSR
ncbi:MAG: hypothetical protein ACREIJ_10595, partial [Nitrospiraceae bacterium]